MSRLFGLLLGCILGFWCFGEAPCHAQETVNVSKPNIIYILADDMGYNDVGVYGQDFIQTPFLDQLAREGMRFTQHYAGSTICAPSRACLLTGKHTGRASVRHNVHTLNQNTDNLLKPGEVTIGHLLQEAGYTTGCIGKWGVGHSPPVTSPNDRGFDYFYGYVNMWHAHNYYPAFLYRNGEKVALSNIVPNNKFTNTGKEGAGDATVKAEYTHDLFVTDALDFITGQAEKGPFFLYLPFTIPHNNGEAAIKLEVPDLNIYTNENWPIDAKRYASMITRMDSGIGQILAALKTLAIDDNTLVIFSTDNGPSDGAAYNIFFDSNGDLRGKKRDVYEGGIRVPMIARWPGRIPADTITHHRSAFWDMLPTFCDLAEVNVPGDIQGISLLPTLLAQGEQAEHDYLYWEYYDKGPRITRQALRWGDWKGVRFVEHKKLGSSSYRPRLSLYNLSEDISETTDLAAQHPDIVTQIERRLDEANEPHYNQAVPEVPDYITNRR